MYGFSAQLEVPFEKVVAKITLALERKGSIRQENEHGVGGRGRPIAVITDRVENDLRADLSDGR